MKWSNGSALTAADVAFTYQMLKKYPDANTTGLAIKSVSSSGDKVTITFPSPQYANLQNIAGQVYIVPQSVWSKVGDPGKYTDANPVGSGPYTLGTFGGQGFTLAANPSYWGGKPAVGKVEFPTYASSNSALSALQTDQLDWGGNFIAGVQQVFVSGSANHHVWFPPVQTNSLEPNLTKFPTNQLAGPQGDQPGHRPHRAQPAGRGRAGAAGRQRERADAAGVPAVPVAGRRLVDPAGTPRRRRGQGRPQAGRLRDGLGRHVPHQGGPEAVDRHHQPVVVRGLRGR